MWWTIGDWKLWCTYGMSGQWSTTKLPHSAIEVEYKDVFGVVFSLYFCDPRRFGTIKFIKSPKEHDKKLASLGPDVLGSELTPELFAKRILIKPDRNICETLMDQSCIAGIGNYIRAEALWLAHVDPWKPVIKMSSRQIMDLYESVVSVSKNSYESGGATIHTYGGPNGEMGSFSSKFVVYGRDVDVDGNEVSTRRDANGRTMHWSHTRQK